MVTTNLHNEFLTTFDQILQDQLKKDIIDKADSKKRNCALVHCIPHHAAIKPNSNTTKVRIVYDASAKSKKGNKSLNQLYSKICTPYYFSSQQTKLKLLLMVKKHFYKFHCKNHAEM